MAFHSFKMILRSNHVRCASVPPEEAIRTAKSPITVPTNASVQRARKDSTASQLTQLGQRQKELGGANRKLSEESSTTVPEDDKDIRQIMSNSSASTMTSCEANRSRAGSSGSSERGRTSSADKDRTMWNEVVDTWERFGDWGMLACLPTYPLTYSLVGY